MLVPVVTALLAFLVGGLVVLAAGANPIGTYKAIFDGSGLNWLFPWVSGDDRTIAALNLQQTLILTTPLILTGLAVAFAFRAGLFNIGGQGQYLVGSIAAVYVGSSLDGMPGAAARDRSRSLAGCVVGGAVGGHRRPAEGDDRGQRGDLDDHAQLDGDLPRRVPVRRSAARCRAATSRSSRSPSPTTSLPARAAARVLGRPGAAGPAHRHLHRARRRRSCSGSCSTARSPATRSAPSASTRTRRSTAASARAATTSRSWSSAACFAGLAGALDVLGWQFRIATNDIQVSQVGFFGIAVALLGRNTAGRDGGRRAAVRRAAQRHVRAQPRPDDLRARSWRRT